MNPYRKYSTLVCNTVTWTVALPTVSLLRHIPGCCVLYTRAACAKTYVIRGKTQVRARDRYTQKVNMFVIL